MKPNQIIKISDLYTEDFQADENDKLVVLLNQEPRREWIKQHPYIKREIKNQDGQIISVPYEFLPIDKVEFLLRRIFKVYQISITGQGTAFNGVWVTVRVEYWHPVMGMMMHHDGIGAIHIQVKSGSSPADLSKINNGAISMAFPHAETLAIKDACDKFGRLFGADLARNDTLQYSFDSSLNKDALLEELKMLYELKKEAISPDDQVQIENIIANQVSKEYRKVISKLKSL